MSSTLNAQQWIWIINIAHSQRIRTQLDNSNHSPFLFSLSIFFFFLLKSHDSFFFFFFYSVACNERLVQVNEVIWLQCFWYTFTIVVVFVQLDVFSTDFTRSKIILVIYYVQTAKSTWWDGDLFIRKQHSIIISVCKQGTSNKVCCRCFDWIAAWRLSSFDMYFITFKQPPLCYSACTFYIIHVNEKKKTGWDLQAISMSLFFWLRF